MLADLYDADEMRELTARIRSASDLELEQMRNHLSEVIGLVTSEWYRRDGSSGGSPQVVSRAAPVEVSVVTSTSHKSGTVMRTCDNRGCGIVYPARQADLARGWGRCCSKSCAASHKLRKNPSHGYLHGGADRERMSAEERRERDHQAALNDCGQGWDGHKDSF